MSGNVNFVESLGYSEDMMAAEPRTRMTSLAASRFRASSQRPRDPTTVINQVNGLRPLIVETYTYLKCKFLEYETYFNSVM